jgi:hypothetical protein
MNGGISPGLGSGLAPLFLLPGFWRKNQETAVHPFYPAAVPAFLPQTRFPGK